MGNQPSADGAKTGAGGAASSSSAATPNNTVAYTSTQANGTGTQTQARKPAQTTITLNVYEPTKGQSAMPGFGIFHTGVEISGTEYCFAGGPNAGSGTGVMTQQPRATPAGGEWKFKEAIVLGAVAIPYDEFNKILRELQDAFPANTYDLIHRNCNHFTTAVAKRLGVHGKYPSWVNRAASWGSMFTAPPASHKPIDLPPPKESVFKTSTGYRLDGTTVAPPKGAKKEEKKAAPTKDEGKAQSSAAGKPRRNPWADPSFVPPGMKDPVVNGFSKTTASGAAAAPSSAAR